MKNREITITAIRVVNDGKIVRLQAETKLQSRDLETFRERCKMEFDSDTIFFDYEQH